MIITDSIIARLLKLKPSQRTDEALYYSLAPHFLGYWTFLQPKYKGQEISDVLFIFHDVCILFEVKTRDKAGLTSLNWTKSILIEAIGQINANYRKLNSGEIKTIRNAWRGEINWEELGIKYYIGVIVLQHISDPFDPYDLLPEFFGESRLPLHVISLMDLTELTKAMNTPFDFIVYWELRYLLRKSYEMQVHNEKGIYFTIIKNWIELSKAQGASSPDDKLAKERSFFEEYSKIVYGITSTDIVAKEEVAASYIIDLVAGSIMSKADIDKTGKHVGSERHNLLVRTVEQLVVLSRRRRGLYGKTWIECAKNSLMNNADSFHFLYSPSRHISFIVYAQISLGNKIPYILGMMKERLKSDDSMIVVGLVASTESILETFAKILSFIDKKDNDISNILNASVLLIDKTV